MEIICINKYVGQARLCPFHSYDLINNHHCRSLPGPPWGLPPWSRRRAAVHLDPRTRLSLKHNDPLIICWCGCILDNDYWILNSFARFLFDWQIGDHCVMSERFWINESKRVLSDWHCCVTCERFLKDLWMAKRMIETSARLPSEAARYSPHAGRSVNSAEHWIVLNYTCTEQQW